MEVTVVMSQFEVILTSVAGPIIASAYFLIKKYLDKKYPDDPWQKKTN